MNLFAANPLLMLLLSFALAGAYSAMVSQVLLRAFKGSRADYAKDRLGKLWDWSVFAAIVAAFFLVVWVDTQVTEGLALMGRVRDGQIYEWLSHPNLLLFLAVIAFWGASYVARGYVRRAEPRWLAKAEVAYGRAFLVDAVLSVISIWLALLLLDHWRLLHSLVSAHWRPEHFLRADEMYGLRWASVAIVVETFFVLFASFAPLQMYMRQSGLVYALFSASVLAFLGSYVLYLVPAFSNLLKDINEHFYSIAVQQYNAVLELPLEGNAAAQTALANQVQLISQQPKGLSSLFVSFTWLTTAFQVVAFLLKAILGVEISKVNGKELTRLAKTLRSRALRSKTQKS